MTDWQMSGLSFTSKYWKNGTKSEIEFFLNV